MLKRVLLATFYSCSMNSLSLDIIDAPLIITTNSLNSKMTERKASAVEFDPNGDVCFELSCPEGKVHLLVSSKILTLVSPVFAAMFNSRFRESLNLHAVFKRTPIPLPEDDGPAFVLLQVAIHYRTDKLPKKLNLLCLENLAVICDKYSCTSALVPWSEMWLKAEIEHLTTKDINRSLFAAYVLDSPDAFSRIWWEIIYNQVGPFTNLPGMADHDLVTGNVLGKSTDIDRSAIIRWTSGAWGTTGRFTFERVQGDRKPIIHSLRQDSMLEQLTKHPAVSRCSSATSPVAAGKRDFTVGNF